MYSYNPYYEKYLAHYGVKHKSGRYPWGSGERPYQNEKLTNYGSYGGTIKKGTELYRIAVNDPKDPTYNNKKYVSTSKQDHEAWQNYLVDAYKKSGHPVYELRYETVKDIKVASSPELSTRVMKELEKNPELMDKTLSEIRDFFPHAKDEELSNPAYFGSYSMAAQTDLGNILISDLLKSGYGAVADTHGWNTSYDPLIILDPDNKIRITGGKQY